MAGAQLRSSHDADCWLRMGMAATEGQVEARHARATAEFDSTRKRCAAPDGHLRSSAHTFSAHALGLFSYRHS